MKILIPKKEFIEQFKADLEAMPDEDKIGLLYQMIYELSGIYLEMSEAFTPENIKLAKDLRQYVEGKR